MFAGAPKRCSTWNIGEAEIECSTWNILRVGSFALQATGEPESMGGMKTYYRPTQMRGKRVIYTSIDPAERKKQTIIGCVAISVFVLMFGVIIWLIS